MDNSFFETQLCQSRRRCHECRLDENYRRGIVLSYEEPKEIEFECPFGKNREDFQGLPGPLKMASNATKAIGRLVKATVEGEGQFATKEEADKRVAICKDCEQRTIKAKKLMCRVCGCFLDLKTKLLTEECPEGKW